MAGEKVELHETGAQFRPTSRDRSMFGAPDLQHGSIRGLGKEVSVGKRSRLPIQEPQTTLPEGQVFRGRRESDAWKSAPVSVRPESRVKGRGSTSPGSLDVRACELTAEEELTGWQRRKDFFKNHECCGARAFAGKANGGAKKLTIRLFSRYQESAHSSEDKAASKGTDLTSDFAGPDDASGVRAADERLRKGDWLLDADARKGPLSRRFRQTRYGGHVEPLRITGSSILFAACWKTQVVHKGRRIFNRVELSPSGIDWIFVVPGTGRNHFRAPVYQDFAAIQARIR